MAQLHRLCQKQGTMFQQMLNGSRAVLLRPSVSTFEEYERNDLSWALIYIAIAAAVTAILPSHPVTFGMPDDCFMRRAKNEKQMKWGVPERSLQAKQRLEARPRKS